MNRIIRGQRYIISILTILILTYPVFGQGNSESKSEQIIQEYEQFRAYRLNDPSKALSHANSCYQLSIELSDSSYMNKSARAVGWLLNSKGEYDTAFYYLKQSIAISKALNDLNQLKFVLNDAGLNRLNLSIYDEALGYFNESLNVRDQIKDFAGKALAYNNIGLVYYNLQDLNEAISYFQKGLSISKEFGNTSGESMNLANIGLSYHLLKDYDNAIFYFKETLEKCNVNCPIEVQIQALGGIGIIHYETKSLNDAIMELNQVISLSIENDVIQYLPTYYHYLTLIDFELQAYDKALVNLSISDKYAYQLQDVEWKKNNLELHAKIYAAKGEFDKAYEYEVRLVDAKDSLLNAEVIKGISDVHVNIQQDKDASIILGKDLEITERNQQLILFGATVVMSMVLLVLLYRNNSLRKKINKQLDYKVKERTKSLYKTNEALMDSRTELDNFIYKTSHDIQGPLATLHGLCNVALMEVKDEKSKDYLVKMKNTSVELNSIISKLQLVNEINSMTMCYDVIDFKQIIMAAIDKEQSMSKEKVVIKPKVTVDEGLEFQSDIRLIEIIFNNLISNCFKFYDASKPVKIIEVNVSGDKGNVTIEVSDNGVGFDIENTKQLFRIFTRFTAVNRSGGIGLYLVKAVTDRLMGTVDVLKREDGFTTFILALPSISNNYQPEASQLLTETI